MEPCPTGLACYLFLQVSMWLMRPSSPPPRTGDMDQSLWREGTRSAWCDQHSDQHVGIFSISECITSLYVCETTLNTLLSLMRKDRIREAKTLQVTQERNENPGFLTLSPELIHTHMHDIHM